MIYKQTHTIFASVIHAIFLIVFFFQYNSHAKPHDETYICLAPQSAFASFGFEGLSFIGEGGVGIVYLIEDIFKRIKLAIKIPHTHMETPQFEHLFNQEQAINSSLKDYLNESLFQRVKSYFRHTGVVDIPFMVVSEYVEGKSMLEYKQQFTTNHVKLTHRSQIFKFEEEKAVEVFKSILEKLNDIHAKGLVHGDLKDENVRINDILVPQGEFKKSVVQTAFIDYGLTGTIGTVDNPIGFDYDAFVRTHGISGTPDKMPPEMLLAKEYTFNGQDVYRTTQIDLYAVGVMLFEWLSGVDLFDLEDFSVTGFDNLLTQKNNINLALQKKWPKDLPKYWLPFFQKALHLDHTQRFQDTWKMLKAMVETMRTGHENLLRETKSFKTLLEEEMEDTDDNNLPLLELDLEEIEGELQAPALPVSTLPFVVDATRNSKGKNALSA